VVIIGGISYETPKLRDSQAGRGGCFPSFRVDRSHVNIAHLVVCNAKHTLVGSGTDDGLRRDDEKREKGDFFSLSLSLSLSFSLSLFIRAIFRSIFLSLPLFLSLSFSPSLSLSLSLSLASPVLPFSLVVLVSNLFRMDLRGETTVGVAKRRFVIGLKREHSHP